jgi:GTP cyclohydrolase I
MPCHLANRPLSLSVSTEARNKKEKDSLYVQIEDLNRGRQIVSVDRPNEGSSKSSTGANINSGNGRERHQIVYSEINVEESNECSPTRTPLARSRAQSPYIQHSTIDFDGLSWPSR